MSNQFTGKPTRPVIIPVGPSIAYVELTKGMFALIDSADAEMIGKFNWSANFRPDGKFCYAVRQQTISGKKCRVPMHAYILGLSGKSITADHVVPDNGLDNRRCNLRPATRSQQQHNKRQNRTTPSGYKGVFRSGAGQWEAQIGCGGKVFYLGKHATPELAYEAYKRASIEKFGSYSRTA